MDNFTGDFFKLIGKPMIWRTTVYGEVAVHVQKISPNGRVAVLTIDGGEASTPAQRFPELSDGIGFAILGDLSKRPARRPLKRAGQPGNAVQELAEKAGLIKPRIVAGKTKRQLVPEDGSHVATRTRKAAAKKENGEVTF